MQKEELWKLKILSPCMQKKNPLRETKKLLQDIRTLESISSCMQQKPNIIFQKSLKLLYIYSIMNLNTISLPGLDDSCYNFCNSC
jgi:hypothetical protein